MKGPVELSSPAEDGPDDARPSVGKTGGAINCSTRASSGSCVVGRTFSANNMIACVKSVNCDERGRTNRHSPESERGSRAAEARSI